MTPGVWRTHRGYAVVLLWTALGHLAWAVDLLLGGKKRHTAPAWHTAFQVLPLTAWGLLHLLTAGAIVGGMYRGILLARVGLVASCGLLLGEAACFAWYGVNNGTSFAFAISLCVFAGIAWRASVEPETPGGV